MHDIVKVMTVFSQNISLNNRTKENGIATQTEIVAVHTPQVIKFFIKADKINNHKAKNYKVSFLGCLIKIF